MNKRQLINQTAATLGCTPTEATKAVEAVIESIGWGIDRDKKVSICRFGTFTLKRRGARVFRSPLSGKEKQLPERWALCFRASPANPLVQE